MTIELPASPVAADEVAATRQPVDRARLLPPRVFHDQHVFDYEQRAWFGRSWLCVGREEDVAEAGSYMLASLPIDSAIIVRARDGRLHALSNVCRHRGSTILDDPHGRIVRLQCPYHAWVYDLDGALLRAPHTDEILDSTRLTSACLDCRLRRGRVSYLSTSTRSLRHLPRTSPTCRLW